MRYEGPGYDEKNQGKLRIHPPVELRNTHSEVEYDPSLVLEITLTALVTVKVEVSPQVVYVRRPECNRA